MSEKKHEQKRRLEKIGEIRIHLIKEINQN